SLIPGTRCPDVPGHRAPRPQMSGVSPSPVLGDSSKRCGHRGLQESTGEMRVLRVAVVFVFMLGLAGCAAGPTEDIIMPEVSGQRLDIALSDIERAGFSDEVEVVGGGLLGVLDESNWEVCEQTPNGGEA